MDSVKKIVYASFFTSTSLSQNIYKEETPLIRSCGFLKYESVFLMNCVFPEGMQTPLRKKKKSKPRQLEIVES